MTKVNLRTQSALKSLQPSVNQSVAGSSLSRDTTSSQAYYLGKFQSLLQTPLNLDDHQDLSLLLTKFLGGAGLPSLNRTEKEINPTDNSISNKEKTRTLAQASAGNIKIDDIEPIFKRELQRLEKKLLNYVNDRCNSLEKKQDLILNKLELLLNDRKYSQDETKYNDTFAHCDSLKDMKLDHEIGRVSDKNVEHIIEI